jgi:drug/metabolite transporter (DMT)-like permease
MCQWHMLSTDWSGNARTRSTQQSVYHLIQKSGDNSKMNKKMQGNLMLLITALIWGSAFVAQSVGMEYVGPFTYNMARSYIGFLVLIPVVLIFRKKRYAENPMTAEEKKVLNHNSIIGGICCGIVLCVASNFQQFALTMTTAGKAGFITALYIIIVPILGIFLGKKVPKIIWLCAAIAIFGFYLLCIKEDFSVGMGDLLGLCCAVCFSFHIMVIDHFTSKNTDSIMISCVQFLTSAIISTITMLIFETPSLNAIWDARIAILYAGVLSSGIAYTLQIVAQRYTNPTVAVLLMSLESVFAALSGWLFLHESMSAKEFAGCALVFLAVILAQIPLPGKKGKNV